MIYEHNIKYDKLYLLSINTNINLNFDNISDC